MKDKLLIFISSVIVLLLLYFFYNKLIKTNQIPKIIIQTWKNDSIPEHYLPLIDSLKKNNPDYKYLFFTDKTIEEFLNEHYPEYYKTYMKLPLKIQKIDFFRYIAIYHYGGFYMDLDVNGMKSFDNLLNEECIFPIDEYINKRMCSIGRYKPFCDRNNYFLLGQYSFAAIPQHPFIKVLIDTIHTNIDDYIEKADLKSHNYVYQTTGPDFVTDLYIKYPNKKKVFILDNGKRQQFGDYAKHNYFGTWK